MYGSLTSSLCCESGTFADDDLLLVDWLDPSLLLPEIEVVQQPTDVTQGQRGQSTACSDDLLDQIRRRRESNRRSQRRHQQKKKAQRRGIEAELAQARAELQQLRSNQNGISRAALPSAADADKQSRPASFRHVPWQAPSALDPSVVDRLVQLPWMSDSCRTDVLSVGRPDDLHELATLPPHQLSLMCRAFVKTAAHCLLVCGQDTAGCSAGVQLQQALNEFCSLNHIKALLDPRGHQILKSLAHCLGDSTTTSSAAKLDWGALVQCLQFSASQQAAICAARRKYILQMIVVSDRRRALLLQLQAVARPLAAANQQEDAQQYLSADDILQQVQSCNLEETAAYMFLLRELGHKICTLWQAAVIVVQSSPHMPDALAIIHAIAEGAGEPSADALFAACGHGAAQGVATNLLGEGFCSKLDVDGKAWQVASSIPIDDLSAQTIFGSLMTLSTESTMPLLC